MPTRSSRGGSALPPINAASPRKRTQTVATVPPHTHSLRRPVHQVVSQQQWEDEVEEQEDEEAEARDKLEIKREKNRVKQRNLRQRRANHVNELQEANAALQSECVSLRHTVRAYQTRQSNVDQWIRDLEKILLKQGMATQVEAVRRVRAPADEPFRVKQPLGGRQPRTKVHASVSASSISSDVNNDFIDPFTALVQVARQEAPASVAMKRSYTNSISGTDHHFEASSVYPTPPEIWEHQVHDHRESYLAPCYPKRAKRETYQQQREVCHPHAQPRGRITHPPPPFYPEHAEYYQPTYRPSSVHGYPSYLSPMAPISEPQSVRPASAGASPGGSPRSNLRISALITPDQGPQTSTATDNVPAESLPDAMVASPPSMSLKNEVKSSPLTPLNEVAHFSILNLARPTQHKPLHTPITPLTALPPLHNVFSASKIWNDFNKLDLDSHRRFSASPLPLSHRDEHKARSHSR